MKNAKFTYVVLFLLSLFSVFLSGCATPKPSVPADPRMWQGGAGNFEVMISSFAAPDIALKGKTYFITSAIKDVRDDDLQFLEVAKYVENALSLSGYKRVTENEKSMADQVLRLAYGIGAPQTSTQTQTTSSGYSYPVGSMWFTVPPTSATTTNTYYMRNLILEAYEQKDQRNPVQIWKTILQSKGATSDLRHALAYMLAASSSYLGTDARRQIEVVIHSEDRRVLNIWK